MPNYSLKNLIFSSLLLLCLTGCMVPNKKIAYLQKDQDYRQMVETNRVLRTYDMQAAPEYHLQKGDQLNIKVSSLTPAQYDVFAQSAQSLAQANMVPQVLGGERGTVISYEVGPLGQVEMPLLGKVPADGLTLSELEKSVQSRLSEYLKDPVVAVRLVNYRFTILGEVRQEGLQSTFNDRLTILEAIGMAGGFDDLANREQVKVIRRTHNGAKATVHYVNLLDENLIASPYFFVQPNDVVVVPPIKQRPMRRYLAQDISIISTVAALIVSVVTLTTR